MIKMPPLYLQPVAYHPSASRAILNDGMNGHTQENTLSQRLGHPSRDILRALVEATFLRTSGYSHQVDQASC